MPQKWTPKEKEEKRKELVKLYINQNKTISEVGEALEISEKTVFDRMKRLNIPTCPEKKPHYRNRKRKRVSLPGLSSKLAEFLGIMFGDGHISSHQITISLNSIADKEYISYVKRLIKFLFGIKTNGYQRKNKNGYDLFLSSIKLVNFLKKKGFYTSNKVSSQIDVPAWILKKEKYKRSFLRGFFDTDGSIYELKFGVQMAFCNHSLPLLKSTRRMLLEFNYHPSKLTSYKIYITRKEELKRYIQEIGFGNVKHRRRAEKFSIIQ